MATLGQVRILVLMWRTDRTFQGSLISPYSRNMNRRFRRRFREIHSRMGDQKDSAILDPRSEELFRRSQWEWDRIQPFS